MREIRTQRVSVPQVPESGLGIRMSADSVTEFTNDCAFLDRVPEHYEERTQLQNHLPCLSFLN